MSPHFPPLFSVMVGRGNVCQFLRTRPVAQSPHFSSVCGGIGVYCVSIVASYLARWLRSLFGLVGSERVAANGAARIQSWARELLRLVGLEPWSTFVRAPTDWHVIMSKLLFSPYRSGRRVQAVKRRRWNAQKQTSQYVVRSRLSIQP